MGLARFGNKMAPAPAPAKAPTTATMTAATPTPAPAKAPNAATASSSPATTTTTTPKAPVVTAPSAAATKKEEEKTNETPKVEVKAEVTGSAAVGSAPPAGQSALMNRMRALATDGTTNPNTAAVAAAIQAAPRTDVIQQAKPGQNAIGALAVGINPPDIAEEWTDEEQDAEAARLSGGGEPLSSTSKGLSVLPEGSATGDTQRQKDEAKAAEEAAKQASKGKGRGKKKDVVQTGLVPQTNTTPPGSTSEKVVTGTVKTVRPDPVVIEIPYTVADAIEDLDTIAKRLMHNKHRSAAAQLAEMIDTLEKFSKVTA